MGKYLLEVSYTAEGARGLMSEGATSRRAYIEGLVGRMGGKVESFYFAFGDIDAYVIVDVPDPTDVAAMSLGVGSSGAVSVTTTVLLTPEQIDEASKKTVEYRPPGA
jgi:uncharacterized protein with GYD domain